MTFTFDCPHCGQNISAASAERGMEATCPNCNNSLTIPTVSPQPDRIASVGPTQPSRFANWIPIVVSAGVSAIIAAALAFSIAKHSSLPAAGRYQPQHPIPPPEMATMPISAEEANRQLHERLDEQGLERHQMAKKNVQLVEEVSNSLFQAPPVTFMEFVKGAFSPEYFEMVFRIIWPVFTLTLVSIVVWQRWKIIQLLKRLPK